eukprot:gene14237-30295_t
MPSTNNKYLEPSIPNYCMWASVCIHRNFTDFKKYDDVTLRISSNRENVINNGRSSLYCEAQT